MAIAGQIELDIRRLDRDRVPEAVSVLARGFQADPNFVDLFPDEERRPRALTALFDISLPDALPFGHVWAAHRDERIAGVAAWLPPGTYQLSFMRQLRSIPGIARLADASPRRIARVMRFQSAITQAHPPEPHWYLEVVGVDPAFQGQDIGTDLLGPTLEEIDRSDDPTYLETVSEATVGWYRKLGFEVIGDNVRFVENGPRFWLMWRPSGTRRANTYPD